LINDAIIIINKNIRPQAISIIEALGVPDIKLQSAIGNSYGDIYETHLEWAKDSRLNKT
jgi:acyl-CoA oxidase